MLLDHLPLAPTKSFNMTQQSKPVNEVFSGTQIEPDLEVSKSTEVVIDTTIMSML